MNSIVNAKPTEPKTSKCEEQLTQLCVLIEQLEKTTHRLVDRLKPVLTPLPPTSTCDQESQPRVPASPLAEILRTQNCRLMYLNEHLNHLDLRLEC